MNLKVAAGMAAVLLTFAFDVHAQAAPKPALPVQTASVPVTPKAPYDSTRAQLLVEREHSAQLQAALLEEQYRQQLQADPNYQKLQTSFKASESDLNTWIAAVRAANGWDASYSYDRQADRWTKTETKKPAGK